MDQAKQLFSTVYWNSGWQGDYCLLSYDIPKVEQEWFLEKGIIVKSCEQLDVQSQKIGDKITACKIYLFDQFFKAWDHVVYLDVDIVTRGSINGVTIGSNQFSACYSLGQDLENNLVSAAEIPEELVRELKAKFDLKKRAFNSGVMSFPTSIIYENMVDDLLQVFNRYVKYGLFGGGSASIEFVFL